MFVALSSEDDASTSRMGVHGVFASSGTLNA
jgi:hypothetical protein